MALPEKIKIGEVEYILKDHPELMGLVQEARTEEKNKLYSTISSSEAKIKVLEDEKSANGKLSTKKEAELKTAQDELAVLKAEKDKLVAQIAKGKKGDDDDEEEEEDTKKKGKKPVQGLTKEDVAELLANALKTQQEGFDKKLEEVKGNLGKKTVGDYKKEQLAKYKDVIIEDFVSDNLDSEEAVNKAIETALEKSKKYIRKEYEVDGAKKELTIAEYEALEASKKNNPTADPSHQHKAPEKPAGGNGDLTGKELLSQLDSMSDEEYAKNADAILREVKSVKYQDS